MMRTVWFTVAALAAAFALTTGGAVASGGDGCPGQYDQYFLVSGDPLAVVDENANGYICAYAKKDPTKRPYMDDNHQPLKK